MSDRETSKADLRAEIRTLRTQLAEQKAEAAQARQREVSYQALVESLTDGVFTAEVRADGTVEAVRLETSAPFSERDVRRVLDEARAQCRHAVHTGQSTTFDAELDRADGRGAWTVSLVPARPEPSHAAHRLSGSMRTRATGSQDRAILHETQTLHRELVELLPDAILIVGRDDRILYVNSAAVRMADAEHERDLVGSSVWTFVHPESRAAARERKHRLWQGTSVDFARHKIRRLDGSTLPVESASVPIVYRDQPAALTAVRDLTGRQRMAEAITKTLDLFDKAFHLGPAALLITRLRDGLILEASERVAELSGYTTDELAGRSIINLGAGIDPGERRAITRELLAGGHVRDRELELRRKDGATRVVLCSARCAEIDGSGCVLVSLVDITQRKQAMLAERESRALLQKIFRASPAPIGIYRLADGSFIDVNKAMCVLVGYDRPDIVGRTSRELGLWVDRARRDELMQRLREQDAVYDFEARFRKASGEVFTALASFQRIQVEGAPCVLAVMTDITSREEAKQALIEAKEKAEEVAHFRSAVLSNMTHEVRTPLTVILGFTSMLREGVQEEYRRFISLIERSGRRLLLTLDSLLDLAQLEAGTLDLDLETHNVPDTIHGITGSLVRLAEEKGLTFELDIPDKRIYARLDYELFGRVLNHLVDNAVKFTKEGGVTVRVCGDDEFVYVEVRDTGLGIEEAFIPRVFEAFAQESEGLTRSHQGSGLGLTVSKRIIDRLGGTIEVESQKGEGTCITIVLPRVRKKGRSACEQNSSQREIQHDGGWGTIGGAA